VNRAKRAERLGGLVASAVALAPFAWLWVMQVRAADEPLTFRIRLDMAIWLVAVFGAPWVLAAQLLWRAWWRRAGGELSTLDGPALLLAAAAATLPAGRRDWGAAMAAELAQVQDRAERWRFALGGARAAAFPPRGDPGAARVAGASAVAAVAAAALATGVALPAGQVFAVTFVGLLGALATLTVARSGRVGRAGSSLAVAATALAGVAACVGYTTYYLAEYPSYQRAHPRATLASLPPVTAVALAVALAGCLWLALAPPRWLVASPHARRFGIAMAIALAAGLVLDSRQDLRHAMGGGVMDYLVNGPLLVVLAGSAAAAAFGRSLRAGLGACAWAVALGAPLLVAAWLAEALRWAQQGRGMLLDGDGGLQVGSNLGDAVWWPLVFLALWALPLGVIGAAAGSFRARRRRARQPANAVPTA
jgi:hypothetical protein